LARRIGEEDPNIDFIEKDPMWESIQKELLNITDSFMASKELIRAVLTSNFEFVKEIFEDVDHVYNLHLPRSVDVNCTALQYAILNNNLDIIKLFADYSKKPRNRCRPLVLALPL